ncbi:MAG TPA: HEPN domain-containing protein [Bacteroidales bacterium]|nr:HEPN domain-containing protein [Bacteroidales bacterium]
MKANIKYWLDLSDYDFQTAKAMLISSRYLYVGFMCHQTIEKILKAYFTAVHNEIPPYSHSLSFLAKKADLYDEFTEDQKGFIDQLEPLNIEARYPLYKEKLLQSLTYEKCEELITETKIVQEWIKVKLSAK